MVSDLTGEPENWIAASESQYRSGQANTKYLVENVNGNVLVRMESVGCRDEALRHKMLWKCGMP